MKNLRVLIPVGLFLAFAIAHQQSNRTYRTVNLSRVTKAIPKGSILSDENVKKVTVFVSRDESDAETKKMFLEYPEYEQTKGLLKVNRDLVAGQLVSRYDLQQPEDVAPELDSDEYGVHIPIDRLNFAAGQLYVGIKIGFLLDRRNGRSGPGARAIDTTGKPRPESVSEPERIGPFRVMGIGDRVQAVGSDEGSRSSSKVLTIAAKINPQDSEFDKAVTRLLRAALESETSDERILALVIWPRENESPTVPARGKSKLVAN